MSTKNDPAEGFTWSAPHGLSPKEQHAAFVKACGEFRSRMTGKTQKEIDKALAEAKDFAEIRSEINGDRRRERAERAKAERRIVGGNITITGNE
jgi:hypothetical protein